MKVTLLGCGALGSVATMVLTNSDVFSKITLADVNVSMANRIALMCPIEVNIVECNANNESDIKKAIKDSDVVLNCVGPFYEFGPKIMKVVIEEGIN